MAYLYMPIQIREQMVGEIGVIILAILTLCGSVVIAYAIWYTNKNTNKTLVQQHKEILDRQVRVESARLILTLREAFEKDEHLQRAAIIIANHTSFEKPENLEWVRTRYLNQLSSITALYYDGTLVEHHVRGYFGSTLNELGAHKETVEYLWDPKGQMYYWPVRKWLQEKTGHQVPR